MIARRMVGGGGGGGVERSGEADEDDERNAETTRSERRLTIRKAQVVVKWLGEGESTRI